MSSQLLLIDNIAFAKRSERLTGSLSLADCPRLSALLESQNLQSHSHALEDNKQAKSVIQYTLNGETNAAGQYLLHLSLISNLTTSCQRCLEVMPLSLTLSFHYLINDNHSDSLDTLDSLEDNDDYDLQEASQTMDLITLIEDEMIMALPIAPVHEIDCGQGSMQSGEKSNPFAALKGLIKS